MKPGLAELSVPQGCASAPGAHRHGVGYSPAHSMGHLNSLDYNTVPASLSDTEVACVCRSPV